MDYLPRAKMFKETSEIERFILILKKYVILIAEVV